MNSKNFKKVMDILLSTNSDGKWEKFSITGLKQTYMAQVGYTLGKI